MNHIKGSQQVSNSTIAPSDKKKPAGVSPLNIELGCNDCYDLYHTKIPYVCICRCHERQKFIEWLKEWYSRYNKHVDSVDASKFMEEKIKELEHA